ncbi:MAG: YggS family pyridoxal phosphate-dependent enzyme [Cyanobacteria bacterium P01_H01_bin.121]
MTAVVADPALIQDRIQQVRAEVPEQVRIMAVTKTVSAAHVRVAYAAGIRDFGENRVQEAIAKQAQLVDLTDITWHLIGHLQSNKARKAVEHFNWIHSVDSLKIAHRLNQIAVDLGKTLTVCLQVKLRSDPDKFGWSVAGLRAALPALKQCLNLHFAGLMVIPPLNCDATATGKIFDEAREILDNLKTLTTAHNWPVTSFCELSMGMSGDYPLAIAAGSTIIRLGTHLFGSRS